jgi:hypothetical protein
MWAFIYDCGHLYLTMGVFIYGYGRFVIMGAFLNMAMSVLAFLFCKI